MSLVKKSMTVEWDSDHRKRAGIKCISRKGILLCESVCECMEENMRQEEKEGQAQRDNESKEDRRTADIYKRICSEVENQP